MSARLVPYYCPYCADEDLRPHSAAGGEWECRSCRRAFALKLLGHLRPEETTQSNRSETLGRRPAQ